MSRVKKQSTVPTSTGGEIRDRARKGTKSAVNDGRARCGEPTKDGSPCRGLATIAGKCPMHSPKVSEAEKKAWRQRGRMVQRAARFPQFTKADFASAEGARAALEEAAVLVRAGKMPVSIVNVVAKIAGTALRASEVALGKRLAEVERELATRAKARR
jgi:hypothetical protein